MVLLKRLRDLLVVGERKVFGEMIAIIDLAIEANRLALEMFRTKDREAIASLNHQLSAIEKKSDELSFMVSEGVSSGAISSNVLGDILEAVDMCDSLLDNYHRMGRELRRSTLEGVECSVPEFLPQFEELLQLQHTALAHLKELLSSGDLVRMQEIRQQIQKLEERGDDVKDASFDKLYALSSSVSYLCFVHVSELLHMMDDVLDGCEDISDLAITVAHSVAK